MLPAPVLTSRSTAPLTCKVRVNLPSAVAENAGAMARATRQNIWRENSRDRTQSSSVFNLSISRSVLGRLRVAEVSKGTAGKALRRSRAAATRGDPEQAVELLPSDARPRADRIHLQVMTPVLDRSHRLAGFLAEQSEIVMDVRVV